MCLLCSVDGLIKEDNFLAIFFETAHLDSMNRFIHGSREKCRDDVKGVHLEIFRSSKDVEGVE